MNHTIARFLLAAGLALPLLAPAAPVTPDDTAPARELRHCHEHRSHHGGEHRGPRSDRDGKPFFLRGIKLTEQQDSKLQALIKEQQPALQEKMEAAHNARQELHQLTLSGKFDEKQAKHLAEASADAQADAELMRARRHAQILQLLTPEQRQQVEKTLQERAARRDARRAETN